MSELSDLEGDLLFDEIIRQRNEAIRQRDEALKALRDQRATWLFAAPTLNAVDLRTFRVPFMEMYNPIGRIDDVLAKYPETKP